MLKKLTLSAAHVIFWAVFIYLSLEIGFQIGKGFDFLISVWPVYIIHMIWAILSVYLFYFRFSVWLLLKRNAIGYFLISLGFCLGISTIFFLLIYLISPAVREIMNLQLWIGSSLTTFIMSQIGTLLRAFSNWYNAQEGKAEREKIKLKNELAMLRSQINPHFLFNTLNNIDSLIREDSQQASKSIIMLSNMMRYMLYESDQEYVKIGQEIHYLKDFIALQRLRYAKAEGIKFSCKIENEEQKIIPHVFLPFIENAFKFATQKEGRALVDIVLMDQEKSLHFICENYFLPFQASTNEQGGLGLENVKRRLENIYKNKHQLTIQKKDDLYKVELIIQYEHSLHSC